ncbi:MAG TPA: DMT family transporter [Acidimicrobiia bacterium]|nr:DMT family transporter [Acidimicrobiia bacterium]
MNDQPSTRRRALGFALAVTVLWSSSWILIRWGLDDHGLRPVGFAGLRYGFAAVVLGGWIATRPKSRAALASLGLPEYLRLAGLGLVFYTLTQGAQFVAIDNQPAATTSLVLSVTPLVVSLASRRLLGEPPSRQQIVGSVLILAGAFLYFSGNLGFTAVGMAAAFVALGSNAGASLLGRWVNRGAALPADVVTVVSMGAGAAVLVAAGVALEGVPRLTGSSWLIVAWLAVVNTALAFTWWNWSLRHLSATASAGINNTMLVQIAVLAWVFLSEAPGPVQWAGMAAVSLGVFFAQAGRLRLRAPAEPRASDREDA